jgi:4-hydroxythreonine-4-phosphate dehydrogenase
VRIGLTLGDPSGIGPEIVCKTIAADRDEHGGDDVVVYGDWGVLEEAADRLGIMFPEHIERVTALSEWFPGKPSTETGRAQVAYLEAAVADAKAGKLQALVTAPIHKASCIAAGFAFPGHTEMLQARLADGGPVTMMFAGPRMRVSLATIHLPLSEVAGALSIDGMRTTIVQTARALIEWFGVKEPRIGIAGLNPHAGESGHFGDEESRIIAPAIALAQKELPAVKLTGPHVPDAVFRAHTDGKLDAVVALYHDQGLIPVKLIDFDEAVNVTLGLPIVRTSPDHGVAHDIAGKHQARAGSLIAALKMARSLVK